MHLVWAGRFRSESMPAFAAGSCCTVCISTGAGRLYNPSFGGASSNWSKVLRVNVDCILDMWLVVEDNGWKMACATPMPSWIHQRRAWPRTMSTTLQPPHAAMLLASHHVPRQAAPGTAAALPHRNGYRCSVIELQHHCRLFIKAPIWSCLQLPLRNVYLLCYHDGSCCMRVHDAHDEAEQCATAHL